MRILIAGGGSIGLRHLENLRFLYPRATIVVWHTSGLSSDNHGISNFADDVVTSFDAALESEPTVAFITCAASKHVSIGIQLARFGVDLFIEKPLSDRMDGVDELTREVKNRNLILMVGYNFRFLKSLNLFRNCVLNKRVGEVYSVRAEVGQYLPDWRSADYRQSVSGRRALGGGVVSELSHELDYLRWIFGDVRDVSANLKKVSHLEIDVEDTADIFLEFESEVVANLHLNMIQRAPSRTCTVHGELGDIFWNGLTGQVSYFHCDLGQWKELSPPNPADRKDSYVDEVTHFFDCVKSRETPLIGGGDACQVLELILAIKRSSVEGCRVRI